MMINAIFGMALGLLSVGLIALIVYKFIRHVYRWFKEFSWL